jgi:STE24 endopeptidase
MNHRTILIVYLALFIVDFLADWLLDVLNLNESLKRRDEIPGVFRGDVDEETYRRSVDYTQRKGRFGLLLSLQNRILLLVVLFTGAAGALDGLIGLLHLPAYWHGFLFLAAASTALGLVKFPSTLYSRFVVEEEFGFNTTTVKTMASDALKETIVGGVLTAALLGGLYGTRAIAGEWWWLFAWGFWIAFQLLMVVVHPLVIAPLFNKFEPLPDGELKTRLAALAEDCGFENRGIFVMDGSRRSRHSNAYFIGIGRFRRIVLYDTLIEGLGTDELEAVLAHEIGHWKHGHVRKGILIAFAAGLVIFAAVGYAMRWPPFFEAFRFSGPSLHALLIWLSFFSAPIAFLLSPLWNIRSRRQEYQADRYAREKTGGPDAMKGALLSLGRDNLSNLTPHPAYSFWHYSHPTLSERLAALEDRPVETPDGPEEDGAGKHGRSEQRSPGNPE